MNKAIKTNSISVIFILLMFAVCGCQYQQKSSTTSTITDASTSTATTITTSINADTTASTPIIITTSSAVYTTPTSPQTSFAGPTFPTETAIEDVPPPAPVPWPNVATYTETTYQINARVGEEFAIGMYATILPMQFTKSYDQNYISLIDDQVVDYLPVTTEGTEWFLFEATREGTTDILFQYPLEFSKVFRIIIN